ncbi:MAG: hypothetical protein KVP17_002576 [Porospora cf. gigantea B]|uniref:uncharacterized protein n=1 Tax=Porospora cf. gigantea B TaxID=2853592 RepID=UPI0035717C74|nr:MAG: hypothetical protein KVP17_002576 [Porospora cf. gigantea B]
MGVSRELAVNPVSDELVCSICRDIIERPVQTVCNHLFCQKCLTSWMAQSATCPIDHHRLAEGDVMRLQDVSTVMFRLYSSTKVKCPRHTICPWVGCLSDLKEHQRECMKKGQLLTETTQRVDAVSRDMRETLDRLEACTKRVAQLERMVCALQDQLQELTDLRTRRKRTSSDSESGTLRKRRRSTKRTQSKR